MPAWSWDQECGNGLHSLGVKCKDGNVTVAPAGKDPHTRAIVAPNTEELQFLLSI